MSTLFHTILFRFHDVHRLEARASRRLLEPASPSKRREQNESRNTSCRVHHPDVHAKSEHLLVGESVRPTGEQTHQSPLPYIPSPKLHLYIGGEKCVGIPQHLMHHATSRNQSLAGELSERNFPNGHTYVFGATKSSSSSYELKYLMALYLIDPNRRLPWRHGRF